MSVVRYFLLAVLGSGICSACAIDSTEPSAAGDVSGPSADIHLATLPTRPDLVSGGNARLVVTGLADASLTDVRILVNGLESEARFVSAGGRVETILTGLIDGANMVRVEAAAGHYGELTIVNHPMGGPLVSGPQLQPWICATPERLDAAEGQPVTYTSGLKNGPLDAQCNVEPELRYFYHTTDQDCAIPLGQEDSCFRPFDPNGPHPSDMATTTTDEGRTLDYIVRVERGAINRGLYDIAVLHDPASPEDELNAWNRKLLWQFGGSTGYLRRQAEPVSTWALDYALGKGFMVAVSSHTDASRNANRVVAAETVIMLKEYVSDRYGLVRYTMGHGCSAGSMQQNIIASMYPGTLNGLVLACSFPDSDGHAQEIFDAFLLNQYFESDTFAQLNEGLTDTEINRKRAEIAGHKDANSVKNFGQFRFAYVPGVWGDEPMNNNCRLPNDLVYDPERNTDGVRCSNADHSIDIWGAYPETGFGRSTKDNEGIQYGLATFLDGRINAEDFVSVNEAAGGIDLDGNYVDERNIASTEALAVVYRTGLITDGHVLAATPVIDLRGDENSSVHYNWSSFALRDRLMNANGNLDNHIIWRVGLPGGGAPWLDQEWLEMGMPQLALDTMDAWLTGIEADRAAGNDVEKMRRNRPETAFDFCYLGTDYSTKVIDQDVCDADPGLMFYSSIRQVAGGPRSTDVLKCTLRPIDRADYQGKLTDAQFDRLKVVFATGVCDWSKPGVEQQPSLGGWMTFATGPGGTRLPDMAQSD